MYKFVSVSLALLLSAGAAIAGDYEAKKEEILDNIDALQVNNEDHSESDRLARFIELFFDYVVNEWPEWATVIGHPTGHERWTDHSLAAMERRNVDERKCLEVLESIDRDQLEGEDRLNLIKLFGLLPRTPYGVIPVPEYAQKSQTTAYYRRGSLEAGRPGYFFANTYDLKARPKWEMEALSLHEAVSGHHLQIAIAQEMEDLPWFRRFGGYTAFTEGWGLYSESLGGEMGFYQDPYSKFGQLTYEIWRAVRLVVDTGMHQFGWSRNEAIEFFKTNTAKSEHDIVVEVDRYIIMPGQALAYKIGELKLKELKERARKELGDKFDIRAFHDAVLGNGALPLQVLELHINDWIAGQKVADSL